MFVGISFNYDYVEKHRKIRGMMRETREENGP